MMDKITLASKLSLKNSFLFPLQSRLAIGEVLWGATLLILLPGVGWLLNMGHRIQLVHHMLHGQPAWPAWKNYGQLLKYGLLTFGGMLFYYLPAGAALAIWLRTAASLWLIIFALLFIPATLAIPGYMTHYCVNFDPAEIYNPFKALKRGLEVGRSYWQAWLIALSALLLSFLGLLFCGVGFLITSVWFWQVAGFSFATTFSQRYGLGQEIHLP